MRKRDEHKISLVHQKALELIVHEGLNGFSMQKLAKAAGVSPATLYIYYKDKNDLILQLGIEEGRRMSVATLKDFDPDMSFEEGMRIQWRNRAEFWLSNPDSIQCFDHLRHSPFRDQIYNSVVSELSEPLGRFTKNAVKKGELKPMPLEVFWSIAYAPLINLIKFHQEGRSVGNRPFSISREIMDQTLELVLKALKP